MLQWTAFMSRSKSCCTRPCCRNEEYQQRQILPPYTQVHQRNPYASHSDYRQQQTLEKVAELVKNQEKTRRVTKKEYEKNIFAGSFRRKYVNIMTRRLSAVISNRDKMKRYSSASSSPLKESETDLDKVTKVRYTHAVKGNFLFELGRNKTFSQILKGLLVATNCHGYLKNILRQLILRQ